MAKVFATKREAVLRSYLAANQQTQPYPCPLSSLHLLLGLINLWFLDTSPAVTPALLSSVYEDLLSPVPPTFAPYNEST